MGVLRERKERSQFAPRIHSKRYGRNYIFMPYANCIQLILEISMMCLNVFQYAATCKKRDKF